MKVAVTILALVATAELVLGGPGYGPPQPLPSPQKYRSPNGAPIPAKYPPFPGGPFGKNEFYSKYNPHSLPPGLRGPQSQLPPPFGKYPAPPPGKQQHQHQHQHQIQHPHPQQQQQQQQQQQHHHQQQQQQQQKYQQQLQQQKPGHHAPNFRPLGPQFQSKPHSALNGFAAQEHQGGLQDQRVQAPPSRPSPKITNGWTGPRPQQQQQQQQPAGPPDFPPRFPSTVAVAATAAAAAAASAHVAVATPSPYAEKVARPSYIINSDDERGPIKTIPAPNLNPADRPANFEEQLYRAQHQQSYAQPLDNSITDDKQSYQVTEDPSVYKPFSSQPSYFAPDLDVGPTPKVPSAVDPNSLPTVGKVPLDIALQQHLDKQHQQLSAEHVGPNGDALTPQELYSLLNGNQAAVVQQTAYMVPQPVMYAVPQPQSLDMQVGHQLHYQPQGVQLQYAAQQPAGAAVQLQYAQPTADLQFLQPQPIQYQQQAVQYQPQSVHYQPQSVSYQQYQQTPTADQYGSQPTAESAAAYKQQHEQQQQQLQEQQQQQQEQQQQHEQQQHEQQQENDVQYQQDQVQDYEPRNREKDVAEQQQQQQQQQQEQQEPVADEEAAVQDQGKFESIRDQYYSAVPNEQTASVLAQIAQSAANNDVAVAADEPGRADTVAKDSADQPSAQLKTTVQVQQSVPLYEGTYTSSRRTNQEYVDEGGDDELMQGSESAVAVSDASVNGHAPSQFPYNAAKINAFASN